MSEQECIKIISMEKEAVTGIAVRIIIEMVTIADIIAKDIMAVDIEKNTVADIIVGIGVNHFKETCLTSNAHEFF